MAHEFRLVTFPREQYLRKVEARIHAAAKDDPDAMVALHLSAVRETDELIKVHQVAAARHSGRTGDRHHRFATSADQLKLYHLDKLAVILL